MDNLLKPFISSLSLIEEKINFIIFLFEISFVLLIILLVIWIYGFVRRNLGIDKQTKELQKIRKIMEKNYKKHNFDYIIRNKYGKLKQTASKIHSRVISNMAITNPTKKI